MSLRRVALRSTSPWRPGGPRRDRHGPASRTALREPALKIALVTPELYSLVRRTALADVAEALSRTLQAQGQDVRVFLPFTRDLRSDPLQDVEAAGVVRVRSDGPLGKEPSFDLTLHTGRLGDVPIVLFDHPALFRGKHPYGDENGPYPDNWRRYAIFSRAVLASFEQISFSPDVLHCMDWTTGLIPVYRELEYLRSDPGHPIAKAGVLFSIQNLALQGSFEREILPRIGLPHAVFRDVRGVALDARVNYLKAGVEFSHMIATTSPTMAARIQEPNRGYGMETTFRRRAKDLVGIVSGIDYSTWDPATDPMLPANFDANDKELAGKRKCKAAIQKGLGLDSGPRTPLIAVLGRFDADNGFSLLAEVTTAILERNFEMVLMGAGQQDIIERLKTIQSTFTGRCRLIEGYHASTAHALLGGADILLLPSHHHASHALPAIGMRYGAVPLVYAHSGLEDTVLDYSADARYATGFTFKSYTGDSLLEAIDEVRSIWKDAAKWKRLAARCLKQDFSWEATAKNYIKVYRRLGRRVKNQLAEV